jgi:hypothetical protein
VELAKGFAFVGGGGRGHGKLIVGKLNCGELVAMAAQSATAAMAMTIGG